MSVLEQTLDELAAEPQSASPALGSPRALEVGRVVVGVVTVFALLAWHDGLPNVLPETIVTAAIWLLALRGVRSSRMISQAAVRAAAQPALAAVLGVAGASLAATLTGGALDLGGTELLAVAGGLAIASSAYDVAVRRFEPRRRVLVVGSAREGVELMAELSAHAEPQFDCIGIVDGDGSSLGAHVVGGIADLPAVVARERPDLVVLAEADDHERVMEHLFDAANVDVHVVDVRHFYEHAFGRVPLENLSPSWFMSVLHLYRRPYSRFSKRALDLVFAISGLVLLAPLFPVLALVVRRSGPGPVLFRQTRVGEGGRLFEVYKFRTMVAEAERDGVAVWASEHDPRITPVGRLLRRTRLDELPQLWNVLRGDMSMVGPRPERPEFADLLASQVPFWTRRNFVKPGITGWAQVRSGYSSDSLGAAEKLSYDLYYLKYRSLLFDVAIAARTAAVVVTGSGAH